MWVLGPVPSRRSRRLLRANLARPAVEGQVSRMAAQFLPVRGEPELALKVSGEPDLKPPKGASRAANKMPFTDEQLEDIIQACDQVECWACSSSVDIFRKADTMSRPMAETKKLRPRRQFDDDLKAQAIRLVLDDGKSVGAVARDLDLTELALRHWVERARADRNDGRTGLTTAIARHRLTRGMGFCSMWIDQMFQVPRPPVTPVEGPETRRLCPRVPGNPSQPYRSAWSTFKELGWPALGERQQCRPAPRGARPRISICTGACALGEAV